MNIDATSSAAKDLDMDDYRAVPPNRVFHVKTRYVYAGRGKPLDIDIAMTPEAPAVQDGL